MQEIDYLGLKKKQKNKKPAVQTEANSNKKVAFLLSS